MESHTVICQHCGREMNSKSDMLYITCSSCLRKTLNPESPYNVKRYIPNKERIEILERRLDELEEVFRKAGMLS